MQQELVWGIALGGVAVWALFDLSYIAKEVGRVADALEVFPEQFERLEGIADSVEQLQKGLAPPGPTSTMMIGASRPMGMVMNGTTRLSPAMAQPVARYHPSGHGYTQHGHRPNRLGSAREGGVPGRGDGTGHAPAPW